MIYQAFDGQKKLKITSPRFSVIRMAIFYLEILAKCDENSAAFLIRFL